MAIVEDTNMADWLKTPDEALIAFREKNPCKLARKMRDEGHDKAPLFGRMIEACKKYKAERAKKE